MKKREKKIISRAQEVIFTPTPQVLCKGSGMNVHSILEGADGHSQESSLPGKALLTASTRGPGSRYVITEAKGIPRHTQHTL